jgi:hypothetical protein
MFEVPRVHPGPQPDTKIFASNYFTGTCDQRGEYLPGLPWEFDFVSVLPQFPRSRIELERTKGYFRRSRGLREHRIDRHLRDDTRAMSTSQSFLFNGLAGDVDWT